MVITQNRILRVCIAVDKFEVMDELIERKPVLADYRGNGS
jgi:hypothetical protein